MIRQTYEFNLLDAMEGDFVNRHGFYRGPGKKPKAARVRRFRKLTRLWKIARYGHGGRIS